MTAPLEVSAARGAATRPVPGTGPADVHDRWPDDGAADADPLLIDVSGLGLDRLTALGRLGDLDALAPDVLAAALRRVAAEALDCADSPVAAFNSAF
ncbi:hypothetical protein [Yinghuangia seranimata]|uniref:hypothetical protein n=1 Tax=Yinghuangia seranimata TaxID=408067 RepID=UPI00248B226B|nr:hypothetical protein [Yinghuangia seranimata]MDI2125319.1 hypothetical protein [Yinghuangia seranimata]